MAWEVQAEVPEGFAGEAGLVDGLRAGSGEAFKALHAAYAARIYNLALRIVDDPEDAQDVAQEVLLKVFRGLPGNETDLNLAAWLYRVTVNAAFDHVRARKRRPVTVVDEHTPEAPAAVDEYERSELARRVEATLRDLPKRQQLALVLRDVHGLSVGETASVLGLTRGSADVLLSRARAGFRRVFLDGAGSLRGRCDRADKALAAGVGRGEPVPSKLLEHSRTCPDCRRAVELWGVAPVGLGLLLPQVALPAKLSLAGTLAAAEAAGIAVPAGLAAAGAAGATAAGSAAAGSAAAGTAAASAGAATALATGGAGLMATLGSAAGIKVATLAAVATAAVGMTSIATRHADAPAATRDPAAGLQSQSREQRQDGGARRREAGVAARQLQRAHGGDVWDGSGGGVRTEGTGARGAGSSGPGPSITASGSHAGLAGSGSATDAGRSSGADTQASGAGGEASGTGGGLGTYGGGQVRGGDGETASGDTQAGQTEGFGGGAGGGTVSRE
jgi:RNA polymerase sigma-70 factor (ECF subfamily)